MQPHPGTRLAPPGRRWRFPVSAGSVLATLQGTLLAALLVTASPARAEVPDPGKTGFLPGTPGETAESYPYRGHHTGGFAGLHTYFRSGNEGSFLEPQLDDTLPHFLVPQDFRFWSGRDGASLLDLEWELPTEVDSRFRGVYRDLRNFDVEVRRSESEWYDRPEDRASSRTSDLVRLRVRKWSQLHLQAEYEDARVQRRSAVYDRDSEWMALRAGATAWLGDVRADLGYRSLDHGDRLEELDAFQDRHLELTLSRDLGANTNLRSFVATDERILLQTEEAQRDLTLSLDTRTYDLFGYRGLKLRTEARYVTRPSSFQRTQDEEESLRLGARFAWDLGAGVLEAGTRETRREVQRLDREGVTTLLQNPATPLATLQGLQESWFPSSRKNWIKGNIPIQQRARIFARFEETAVDGPPRTSWVTGRAPSLYYTNQSGSVVSLSLFPLEGIDMRAERKLEERFMTGRGDHSAGQSQRLEASYFQVHVHFLSRFDMQFQFTENSTFHVDDVVQNETVFDVTDQAWDLAYSLTPGVSLEASYQRLAHDGVSNASQEIVGYALDFGATGHPAELRLEYTRDDFFDPSESDSSYRAQVVSLAGKVHF